ncbi:hypothetical protein BKA82DRAFT_413568 [Pisolithus tinctorius]|nr:hypothetical protein BKA82DRAFT_413568 [Pisolithus tinctorius]
MAYIVHLVHILEILFAVMDDKNLTRDAVNLAFNIYRQSEMWRNAHLQIKGFDCRIPSRDAVLDKIASLVVMSPFDDKDISWALERIPPGAPERVEEWYTNSDDSALRERLASLANLVNDLNLQFSREGDMDTLADIINFQRAILDITPPLRRERLTSVVNLANSLDKRFKAKGGIEDLGQVIDLRRAALQLTFPGHQGRVMSLDDLANAPKERFLRDGDTDDLKEAITLRRASPQLTSPGHQGDVASLDNLANSLLERFRREADASDLEEIIILRRAALQLTPPGRQGHVVFLDNLADSLHERHRREPGASDLAEIVRLRRTALQLTPPEHPEHPVFLAKLLDCLDERFSKEGGTKDLTEIITLRLTALQFTPPGHPGRFASLVSLSNSLHERFRRGDDLADLDEVITLRRTALECTPPSPSDKCMSLLNLATCLREKYQRLCVKDDLAEAVTHARAALALCPLEHYDSCLDFLADCVDLLTRKWRLPNLTMQAIGSGAGSSGVKQMVRNIVAETIKTLPPRLLNTITGVLCDRDAQISYFEGSVHYDELLSSLSSISSIHDDPACKALVHSTISKFFRYGTLSHRWGTGEPLLRDIQGNNIYDLGDGEGIAKLRNFSLFTLRHRYSWAWSDTCCINKDSSSELQEAIASMFSWYHHSALTIVHLSDVSDSASFTNSVWFRRGWTLQELLASPRILFYTQDWSLYKGCTSPNHKVDSAIFAELQEATGIGESHLKNFSPGIDDARSRLRWASARSTTRSEDSAYSLFGIFQVHLPVIYGEFAEGALGRLLVEIISRSGDVSVLDWVGEASPFHSCFPASLTPYQTLSCAQSTPSDPSKYNGVDRGEERILYNALVQLPSPRFVGRRLALPCIVHRITRVKLLATSSNTSCHDYEIAATNLVPLKLTMSSHLQEGSGTTLPYALIRPWSPKVLDLLAPGDVLGSLLEWLGQPFNALLLESSLHNDWKRIASSCLINVRVEDVAGVLDSQCQTLEIV